MKRPILASILALAVTASIGIGFHRFRPHPPRAPEPSAVPVSLGTQHQAWSHRTPHHHRRRQTKSLLVHALHRHQQHRQRRSIHPRCPTHDRHRPIPGSLQRRARATSSKIKELYADKLMLFPPTDILGKLLQGEDNAKDGVVVFGDVDADARDFQVCISGLSGETAEVMNPITSKPRSSKNPHP